MYTNCTFHACDFFEDAAKKSSVFDRLGADSTGLNVSPKVTMPVSGGAATEVLFRAI